MPPNLIKSRMFWRLLLLLAFFLGGEASAWPAFLKKLFCRRLLVEAKQVQIPIPSFKPLTPQALKKWAEVVLVLKNGTQFRACISYLSEAELGQREITLKQGRGVATPPAQSHLNESEIDFSRSLIFPPVAFDPHRSKLKKNSEVQIRLERARFTRNEDSETSERFEQGSKIVQKMFLEYLTGSDWQNVSIQSLVELMRRFYLGKYTYRAEGMVFDIHSKKRFDGVRRLARHLGLSIDTRGIRIPLEGIPVEYQPYFSSEYYLYSAFDLKMMKIYYDALQVQIDRYVTAMNEGKESEAWVAMIEYGRIAAAFRPFEEGNWGLFGSKMNVMLAGLGDYVPTHAGFLDMLLQVCEPSSLYHRLPQLFKARERFYFGDGRDPF